MAEQINWTEPALEDLDQIFDFIARDSPHFAESFTQQIMDSVTRLEAFPQIGRVVPEAGQEDIREIIFQSYRILYWVLSKQRIDIIAVVHGSRDLNNPDVQPWEMG